MGRRKLELKPIVDDAKRYTAFTKRRFGLVKKVKEYCNKFDAHGVVLAYSKFGNGYFWGHPRVQTIMERYIEEKGGKVEDGDEEEGEIDDAIGNWPAAWAEVMEGMGIDELDRFAAAVEKMKREVVAEAESRELM